MVLTVSINAVVSKCGPTLCAKAMRLTASGVTIDDAKMRLEQGITAWCNALQRSGRFEDALRRAHLFVENNGSEDLNIVTVFQEEPQ